MRSASARPPSRGLAAWVRAHPRDTVAFAGLAVLVLWFAPPLLRWAVLDATWTGESRQACGAGGACWAIVTARWRQVLAGFYPEDHLWRVALATLLLAGAAAPLAWRRSARYTPVIAPLAVVGALAVMHGAGVLPRAPTDYWGGFFLNLLIGVTASIFALPLGVLLALGRNGRLPAVRWLATGFVEGVRASPLIVLLFAASVIVPLFTPAGVSLDKLTRALVVITLFEAAYMAEAVRAGLRGAPRGQAEAAQALGLRRGQTLRLVVLPQALRIATPALVNSFIGLFKDTSLIYVIGVLDVTGVLRNAVTDFAWQGLETEAYVFVALLFWSFCFGLSRWSRSLERRLDGSGRRPA
ncbi:amino acid ABC transporter permease [Phenylobacterium sp.]|uniref:amino acid ABC transporter permease n=1 Tax=Phenylobacterium sp. TaxID=1871053 RepID=UPI003919B984